VGVTTRAIDSIRQMISSGDLRPGDRLPPEQELADQLGVSRGSLREAVRALSQINVLDVRRGDGTYVTSLAPSELLSGLAFAIDLLQTHGVDEVLEVRRMMFPAATALAAQRVTAEQLAAMHVVIDELEVATEPAEVARLQGRFQALVGQATGNETLSSILSAIQLRDENVRRAWLTSPKRREVALAHDRMLLEAFERGDSEMARSIATVRVDTREQWIESLRSGSASPPSVGAAPATNER
jgi:GntR family transcriptional regulator, transcriptional repressor for pyruvate dehydrogenase complex